jgi:hypothetical protein
MWWKSLVAIALVSGLPSCASESGIQTRSAQEPAPAQAPTATTCVWRFAPSVPGPTGTPPNSAMIVSNNGWCGGRLVFAHHKLIVVPMMVTMIAPSHGTASFPEDENDAVHINYAPATGYVGNDSMVIKAEYGKSVELIYVFNILVAGADGFLKRDPLPHTLPRHWSVLVDDKSCPTGQIRQVTGGTPRKIACITRPA